MNVSRATSILSSTLRCVIALPLLMVVAVEVCAQNDTIAHGTLPTDTRYWEFHRWYRTHSVVDVVVNGEDSAHLQKTLSHIEALRERNVHVRDIIVIGGNSFSLLDKSTRSGVLEVARKGGSEQSAAFARLGVVPAYLTLAESLSLGEGEQLGNVEGIIQKLQVSASPTWIVTYRGEMYIYEGYDNLLKQFSRVGEFRSAVER